jgi:hypothetical protein
MFDAGAAIFAAPASMLLMTIPVRHAEFTTG